MKVRGSLKHKIATILLEREDSPPRVRVRELHAKILMQDPRALLSSIQINDSSDSLDLIYVASDYITLEIVERFTCAIEAAKKLSYRVNSATITSNQKLAPSLEKAARAANICAVHVPEVFTMRTIYFKRKTR